MPAPAPLLNADKYQRHSLQRPFSFTQGTVPEAAFSQALGAQLGILFTFCLILLHAATHHFPQHDVGVWSDQQMQRSIVSLQTQT